MPDCGILNIIVIFFMIIPDFSREENLIRRGYGLVAGMDEAGRGPLAGPVVAAAVILKNDPGILGELSEAGVRDSKKVSERRRNFLYTLISEKAVCWGVGIVSEKTIDEINILNAAKLAMRIALDKLEIEPDFLLIDGDFTLGDVSIDQLAVPKADQSVLSVSAASIIAKVTRDRILVEMDGKYPGYGFARHKGYGTKMHLDALAAKGPCEIHRRSFEPIKSIFG